MDTLSIVVWLAISLVVVALSFRYQSLSRLFILCYVVALAPHSEELGSRTIRMLAMLF